MVLSLLVVAGAEQQTVTLKTAKSVNGSEVTYTFTLDATGSDGVGALSFYVETTGLTFKKVVYNNGGTELDKVFKPSTVGEVGEDGAYGFYEKMGRFFAYGGDYKTGRLLKGIVVLVAVTYTIDDPAYGLTIKTGADGFKACYSGARHMTETGKYNCVAAPITDSGSGTTGVTVSGTALSWNDTDDAVYLLYPAATTDDAIKAEWKSAAYTGTACTEKGAIAASGKQYGQSFTFGNVAAGEYKLAILKPGKYVPKIVAITVGSEDLALGEMKLWLYGDVNYDGAANAKDATQIARYANGKGSLFTNGTPEENAERLMACDINADDAVNSKDATQIIRYANGKGSLFNNFV